ncbi:DUF6301 family protein [Actinocatenispora comari]|uniref:Uncharacterized protein n=1 Tax=Actinocatenispora comari TaxID=2807577 RepID=A0A8J4AHD6_9ACTN|nr:DUF6301 family protein [Actinocatenispora comari]GIL31586.1 hypothetical protein NUM_68400 [Actinocatenispora comari]
MVEWRALNADELRQLVGIWAPDSFDWSEGSLETLAAAAGWRVQERIPDSIRYVTGLPLQPGTADVVLDGSTVNRIRLRITNRIDPADPGGVDRLRDAFVDATEHIGRLLGEPTRRVPGERPEIRWRTAGCTLVLERLTVSLMLAFVRNEYQDLWDRIDGAGE